MKLYELTQIYNNLMDLDLSEDELKVHITNIEDEIEEKADNIAKVLKSMDAEAVALKDEETRLAEKRKVIENRSKGLKMYLQDQMILVDKKKFKTTLFSFNIQKNAPSLKIIDESKVPEEFFIIERKLNKTELKNAVKDGLYADAAILESTESLRIRWGVWIMSNMVLIIGESGTGKSTAIEGLNPNETFIIQVVNKPLPFKGFKVKYPLKTKENDGNRIVSGKWNQIISVLEYLNNNPGIKVVVIDDSQYLMSDEYMTRATERGFDKFTEIGQHYYDVIKFAAGLREDLTIVFLSHSEVKDDGRIKVKTIGKLLDEKITIEGLFTVVLNTKIEDGNYYFETQNNGFNTTKSPKGMFESVKIPNDLGYVVEKINEYYGG